MCREIVNVNKKNPTLMRHFVAAAFGLKTHAERRPALINNYPVMKHRETNWSEVKSRKPSNARRSHALGVERTYFDVTSKFKSTTVPQFDNGK